MRGIVFSERASDHPLDGWARLSMGSLRGLSEVRRGRLLQQAESEVISTWPSSSGSPVARLQAELGRFVGDHGEGRAKRACAWR